MVGCLQEKFLSDIFLFKGLQIIIRKSKMDSRDLLRLIGKNKDTQQFWEKFLGKDILNELLKHPELLSMQDAKCAKTAEEEKEFFVKCIFSVSTENGFKFEREERVFDSFYEKLGQYTRIILKQKLIASLAENMIDSLVKQIVQRVFWIPFRCLIADMHEKKDAGQLNGHSSAEEYDDYVNKYLLNERECREFLKKYLVMTELLIRKIRDYINYVNEILQHFYQDREAISKEFHIEQNAMEITELSFNQDEEHFPGRMVAQILLKGGERIYYKPHSLLLTKQYQKIENWLWEKMGLEKSRHWVVSGDDYGWEQEVIEAECKYAKEIKEFYYRCGAECCLTYVLGMTDIHMDNVIAHGKYPVIIDTEFMFDRRIEVGTQGKNLQQNLMDTVMHTGFVPNGMGTMHINVSVLNTCDERRLPVKMPMVINKGTSEMNISYYYPKLSHKKNVPIYEGKYISFENYMDEFISGFRKAYDCIKADSEVLAGMCQPIMKKKVRYLFRNTQEYYMYITSFNFPELMRNQAKRQLSLWHMNRGLHCNEKYRVKILTYEMQCVYDGIVPIFYAEGRNLLMGNGEYIKNYFQRDNEQQLKLRVEKLSDWDKDFQTKVIQSVLLMYAKKKESWDGQLGQLQPKIGELTAERIAKWVFNAAVLTGDKMEWTSVIYGKDGWTKAGKADIYLYNGLSGILLFFEAMWQKKYKDAYYSVIEQLKKQLFEHTDILIQNGSSHQSDRMGLFDGEASVAFTYWIMYKLTAEEKYMIYAKKQCQFVLNNGYQEDSDDLIQGRTGIIILILLMYKTTKDRTYLDTAQKAGKNLVESIQLKNCLAGMAHGYSGMAVAMALLGKHIGEENYKEIVLELCRKEDQLFDCSVNNWLDIREGRENPRNTIAWCHGSAGILLARALIHKISGLSINQLFKGIPLNQVIDQMCQTEKTDWCLCHGQAGLLIVERYIRHVFDYEEEKWYENAAKYLDKRLSMEDVLNYGIMQGLAGIGMLLLFWEWERDKGTK